MATKDDLKQWVLDAVTALGGSATIPCVAERLWGDHEAELRASGDLFWTWQYHMRWAAQSLRDQGLLAAKQSRRTGTWDLP